MHATTDKDATTPYLLTTTRRRLRPPGSSATIERMLRHPIYQRPMEGGYDPHAGLFTALAPPNHPYMIIQSLTFVHLWIFQLNVQRPLFEILNPFLYTLKRISSFNIHVSSL